MCHCYSENTILGAELAGAGAACSGMQKHAAPRAMCGWGLEGPVAGVLPDPCSQRAAGPCLYHLSGDRHARLFHCLLPAKAPWIKPSAQRTLGTKLYWGGDGTVVLRRAVKNDRE